MKQKLVIGSVLVAAIIVLTSLASVVGKTTDVNTVRMIDSPLFTARSQPDSVMVATRYLGHGESNELLCVDSVRYNGYVADAIQVLNSQPAIREQLFERVESNPQILALIQEYGLSIDQIKQDMDEQLQSPDDLRQYMREYLGDMSDITPPEPLGLSTSSAIGCFIVVIALLPLLLILTVMIATITIVTCLNVGGCFEAIWTQIGESLIQGLSPCN